MRAIRRSVPNTADNAEAPHYRSCIGKELHWKVTAGWIHTVAGNSISSAGKGKDVTVGMKQVSPCEGGRDLAALGSLSNALSGFVYKLETHKKGKCGGFTAVKLSNLKKILLIDYIIWRISWASKPLMTNWHTHCSGLGGGTHMKIKNIYIYIYIYIKGSGFGGLGVPCWPLVHKFAGSNPTEAVGFLGRKNPQHAFLRRGSKAVGPMS